ncbi:hypothetical protein PS6_003754 [Mucor atramentarius]
MPSTARNLWFRLIHNKVSSKVNVSHILRLPDDLCEFCGYRETTAHMLFTCPSHLEIWSNYFSLVFVPTGALDMNSPLKVSVFEAVTCVITAIWRAKWRAHFDNADFDNQSVLDRAMINLRHISSLNSF